MSFRTFCSNALCKHFVKLIVSKSNVFGGSNEARNQEQENKKCYIFYDGKTNNSTIPYVTRLQSSVCFNVIFETVIMYIWGFI